MPQTGGVRAKILAGAKLSTLHFLSNIGLRLVSTVVLTRLLAPEIYGVFAVVLVYLYVLEMFSDLGIRDVILTKEGEAEDDFLRTCWTVSILRGCVIALFSVVIAACIIGLQSKGSFSPDSPYAAPALPWALAALGGTVIIASAVSPMAYIEERNMRFGKVTMISIVTNVTGLIVTIVLAYFLRSIWALVLGNALRNVMTTTLSFMVFRGPPMRLMLRQTYFDIVIDRGKWIVGHSALQALSMAGDRLVLGFVMSSSSFGYYFIARQLVDIVQSFLASFDSQMGLQVFTHLHATATERFRKNYYRYRLFFDAIAGVSTGVLVVLSPLIVRILFDDRYLEVADFAQILVWGALLAGPLLLRSAFKAERRFKEMTMLSIVSAVTLWAGLFTTVFLMDSVTAALTVIALYRLPEAMLLVILGGDRDWVIIWREFGSFAFCGLGIAIGWVMLLLWNALV